MLKTTVSAYSNAYSGLSKESWLLSFIMLINRSGTMVVPFLTLYLTSPEMGFTIGEAGIIFGIFGLGAFSGAWLGGRITDKIGFYPVQIFTLLIGGILFIVLGQMKSYYLIGTFTFLLSFFNEAFRPANSTAIAFYSKEENRTRSYALNRLAINLGWAVGSGLGGFLSDINFELLFWVDGITNIMAAFLLWIYLKPAVNKLVMKDSLHSNMIQSAHKDKKYVSFILVTTIFACCFFQLFNNLPLYFNKDLHLSKPLIGLIMASNGIIIAIVEMVLIYKLEGRRKNTHYITFGVLLVGLSFLLLNIPVHPLLVAITMMMLVTFGEILSLPFMNSYWIGRTQSTNRGQYAALYTMAWSAAQTIGPMGGAQIAQYAGFNTLWWIVGGLSIFASFIFWKLEN